MPYYVWDLNRDLNLRSTHLGLEIMLIMQGMWFEGLGFRISFVI